MSMATYNYTHKHHSCVYKLKSSFISVPRNYFLQKILPGHPQYLLMQTRSPQTSQVANVLECTYQNINKRKTVKCFATFGAPGSGFQGRNSWRRGLNAGSHSCNLPERKAWGMGSPSTEPITPKGLSVFRKLHKFCWVFFFFQTKYDLSTYSTENCLKGKKEGHG